MIGFGLVRLGQSEAGMGRHERGSRAVPVEGGMVSGGSSAGMNKA